MIWPIFHNHLKLQKCHVFSCSCGRMLIMIYYLNRSSIISVLALGSPQCYWEELFKLLPNSKKRGSFIQSEIVWWARECLMLNWKSTRHNPESQKSLSAFSSNALGTCKPAGHSSFKVNFRHTVTRFTCLAVSPLTPDTQWRSSSSESGREWRTRLRPCPVMFLSLPIRRNISPSTAP